MKIDGEFYTEMQYIAPYMQNNDIANIAEALDNIAYANNLNKHAVGLIVESQECVTSKIKEALANKNFKFLGKVKKGEDLASRLKSNGFKVKKKKSSKNESTGFIESESKKGVKCCPECGLPIAECTCGKKETATKEMFEFDFK